MADDAEVIWAPSADRDLGRIFEQLHLRNPDAAVRTVRRIMDAVDGPESQPLMGAIADDVPPRGRCRQLIVRPFRILYSVEGPRVDLLRVGVSRRDPKELRVPATPDEDG
jgi:plasmid stabilization system protein ParE